MSYEKLNERQKRFVDEYIIDLNGQEAYKRAGYEVSNDKVAGVAASRLLADVRVYSAVQEALGRRKERTEITQEWVLESLQSVALRCMQGEEVVRYNRSTQEYEPTGEWKFDSAGANKSLELLGKHMKLFTDKIEQENTGQVSVNFNIPRPNFKKEKDDGN